MIQNLIVVLFILIALAYTGHSVYQSLRPGTKSKSACGGCTGCQLKDLKTSCGEITPKSFSGKYKQPYTTRKKKIVY
jgi:hypothetical protein